MNFRTRPDSTPQGALARLWRNVIKDNKLEHSLGYLITRYIARNGSSNSKNLRRRTRSTIEADITASSMTWKKFTHLIFHYLGASRLDVTIKITFSNGTQSVHTVGLRSSDNVTDSDNTVNENNEGKDNEQPKKGTK